MNQIAPGRDPLAISLPASNPTHVSRRAFLGAGAAAFIIGAVLPSRRAMAQAADAADAAARPGTNVSAYLEIHGDNSVKLLSPFVEGGQGIATGMAQIVGEELDVDPAHFVVECAPPGPDYAIVNGIRMTGGSFSTRSAYPVMRQLGATAREMLLRAAAARLGVQVDDLTTDDGIIIHAATGQRLTYGDVAAEALQLKPREGVALRDPKDFRYIRHPMKRLDVRDKSTGRARYSIDQAVEGMLYAAVVHSPYFGTEPRGLGNEAEVLAMPGVHSVHSLPGAVAVTANSWWRARKAVETLEVTWSDPAPSGLTSVARDFSSGAMLDALRSSTGQGQIAEEAGDTDAAFRSAAKVIESEYDAPYLAHAQLEPPSALARFSGDGSLDVWLPNQMPELFQQVSARTAGIAPEQVRIHSPILGGFFGRHFHYGPANPFPQAILLAKATGRPVKVVWSREEEFLNDALRPLSHTQFRAALDPKGQVSAIEARTVGEGPIGRYFGGGGVDSSAVEGIADKPYAVPNRRMEYVKLVHPVNIAFWRSVGHSMNDFFYEGFLDEVADAAGRDPLEMRMELLQHSPRHRTLLETVASLSGGWRRGPYDAEGTKRARGIAMASPFGSETATIAEVSLVDAEIRVHNLWIAFDPGSIVNPAIVKAQVESAAALGLSSALVEQVVYENGIRRDQNYDTYRVLTREMMPQVHVEIVESGAPMGGVGEPGLPGVPPAVVNAVATLTGTRVRSLPLANTTFKGAS
jgi:isoquinoline 1-oxidoreductase beta subunit